MAAAYQQDAKPAPRERGWQRLRSPAALVLGAIGCLSVGASWMLAQHPDLVAGMLLGTLLGPAGPAAATPPLGMAQLGAYFTLSWVPLTAMTAHGLSAFGQEASPASLSQLSDPTPLLWQGLLYIGLAGLVWRRSMPALLAATAMFVVDSAIYVLGIVALYQTLWQQNQEYAEFVQAYPSVAGTSWSDVVHWPWGLLAPIVVRLVIFSCLLMTLRAMALARRRHRRPKAAAIEAAAQAA